MSSENVKQNKQAEIVIGVGTPEDKWLDGASGYNVRYGHLKLLELTSVTGKLILDAGCGPGTYGIIQSQLGNEVVGIEISPDAVREANRRAKEKGANFIARTGDLENLPFIDNTFDICFCGWVLHHFPDISMAMSELVRVLKPDGIIALVEPNESNLLVRFSRFVEDFPVLRKWILLEGWDTPNRTITKYQIYIGALKRNGVTDIKISSCFLSGLSSLPPKAKKGFWRLISLTVIRIWFRMRRAILTLSSRILRPPLNGADLLIKGKKPDN